MLKPDVNIEIESYYTVNEISQLRQFVADNVNFLIEQKLSAINIKLNQLRRR